MTIENKIFTKTVLCILFLIFYSNSIFCQPVEEIIVIEKFEDNVTDPIDSLYILKERKNSLHISTEKRHFLYQSDEDAQINKVQLLGNTLARKIEDIPSPKTFSVIAANKAQFMQNSHSVHLGLIETPNFQMYSGFLTSIKNRFYTAAQPSVTLSPKSRIFFPFAFNYNYNTHNFINNRFGIGFQYNSRSISAVTTAMAVFDINIDKPEYIGGIEAVHQLQWKNSVNHAEIVITNEKASLLESFTFVRNFFMLCAGSSFAVEYETQYFSMNHSLTAAFTFGNTAIFVRSYTDSKEYDIEKSIKEITPWKRSLNAEQADYTMEYLEIHWYSGVQVRWKHNKLLLEASSYAAADSAITDINNSQWNPTTPFFAQTATAGFYNEEMMFRFSPFICIGNNVLDFGINSSIDVTAKHSITFATNNGVQFSQITKNIQIDNEIKLGYCLLEHWYLYHSAYFCSKYNFAVEKYSLSGKIGGGVLFQF